MTKTTEKNTLHRLFNAIDSDGDGKIMAHDIAQVLTEKGILADDPRMTEFYAALAQHPAHEPITEKEFAGIIKPGLPLFEKCVKGHLVIPEFTKFTQELTVIFEKVKKINTGKVATYIPQLAKVDPNIFGLSICTVDGQQFHLGNSEEMFCVQSCCKPISYCIALQELGEDKVHRHVGREPSGVAFNELTLNRQRLPHNPMINAGTIMTSALIQAKLNNAERFEYVLDIWKKLSGGKTVGFNNSVYLSEKETADRNFALAYFMRENKAFPPNTDIVNTLEFYFQCCSIELTTPALANIAACLANSGISPLTGEKIFNAHIVKDCLSLMYSCGMYNFSGEWAFTIGLPAKSGVSGAIMVVIPDVMGICLWSPPLDESGNSVKGIEFCRELVNTYNFHNYDSILKSEDKIDPRKKTGFIKLDLTLSLLAAASQGDLRTVAELYAQGADLNSADYDGRTALHLAAAEGQLTVVEYLLHKKVKLNPKDRWGGTPLDDAKQGKHKKIIALLSK